MTYDLHVIVRFELERALIDGSLSVADLPGAWNEAYRTRLGVEVSDDAAGCLQDVHWSCGLFGYFPTYTLGNLYAASLAASARRDLSDLDAKIASGSFAELREWLSEHVWRHGRRHRPEELVRQAAGASTGELDPAVLLDYLRSKVRAVYGND